MFAYVCALTALSSYLAAAPFRFTDSQTGGVIAAAGVGGILISPVAGWFADRIGRAVTATIGLAVVAATFASLELASGLFMLSLLFFVLGGAMGFCWAGLMTLSVELLPGARGTASSVFNAIRFSGYAIAPQLSSLLYVRCGMAYVFLAAALFALAAAILAAFLRGVEGASRQNSA